MVVVVVGRMVGKVCHSPIPGQSKQGKGTRGSRTRRWRCRWGKDESGTRMGTDESAAVIKGHGDGGASLAVPKNVLDEGVKITREALDQVCEIAE